MAARPLPALIDDLVTEILLHLTPDDIACIARASLVCKAWRHIFAGRAFLRRYREIHGAPPVLGFLYNNKSTGASCPLFLRTTKPSPLPPPAASASIPTYCRTLDCRHGRVLLHHPGYHPLRFTVWDPITGKQQCFSAPWYPYGQYPVGAAVLCAATGCDHISCSGEPFLMVSLEKAVRKYWQLDPTLPLTVSMAQAWVYSSETGKWTLSASFDFPSFTGTTPTTPSLLAGDTVFFLVISGGSRQIIKCDLTRGVLSTISVPSIDHVENMILCTAKDGDLGVAAVEGCTLRLWSGGTDLDGVTRWVQNRAIELDLMIPIGVGGASTKFNVVGFAEGAGYIFVGTNDRIFSVELKSCRVNMTGSGKNFGTIFPMMGFYIPDLANTRLEVH